MISDILVLIIRTVFTIVILATVARLMAQVVRADFYNPLAQAVLKITNPFLLPLRKIIPGFGGLDNAAILLAILLQLAMASLMLLVKGYGISQLGSLLILSILAVIGVVLTIIKWGIIIVAIASFIAPGSYNPFLAFIAQITDPFIAPIRRFMPSAGGLDFSPMVLILVLIILQDMILGPMAVRMDPRAVLMFGL
jgi:YggT family protein